MRVALVSRGTVEANRAKVTDTGVTHVFLQNDREVAQAYQAHGTPSAVLVRQDGTIGSPLAQGADAIRALVSATLDGTLPMTARNGQESANRRRISACPISLAKRSSSRVFEEPRRWCSSGDPAAASARACSLI
jgi:hypothetical protein